VLVLLLGVLVGAVALTGPVAEEVGSQAGIGSAAVTAWDIVKWPVLGLIVLAILFGAELNAEIERSRELRLETPGAERRLQLDERSEPKKKKRARTA
jgi:membrane protein